MSDTRSPIEVSSRLTRMVERLGLGQATPSQVDHECLLSLAELNGLRQDFLAAVKAESVAMRCLLKREIDTIHVAFEDFRGLLQACHSLAQDDPGRSPGEPDWDVLLVNLRLADTRLNLGLLRFRDCLLSERGPTTHPGVNHLLAVRADDRDRFEAIWEEEMIRARSALEELDQEMPYGTQVYNFNLSYLSLLEERPLGSENLSSWLGQLRVLADSFAALDIDYFSRHFAWGPTSLTWLNLIMHAAWQNQIGFVSTELVYRCLGLAREQLEAMQARHRIYMHGLADDAPERAAGKRAKKTLAELAELVEHYVSWLGNSKDDLTPLASRAQVLAHDLDEIREELLSLQDPSGEAEISASAEAEAEGSRFKQLVEAGRAVLDGDPGPQQLRDVLKETRDDLARARRQGELTPQRLSPRDLLLVRQLQQDYRVALGRFEAALEFLDLLLDSPSPETLRQAEEELAEGNADVEEAYRALRSALG